MKRNILALLTIAVLSTSCVSSKIYEDLKEKNSQLRAENKSLMSRLDDRAGNRDAPGMANLRQEIEKLNSDKSRLAMDLQACENNYNRLKVSYEALEAN